MKSLVIQGNGCTIFNENGENVYRNYNYDKKCSNKLNLMDLQGNVLLTILRKVRYLKLYSLRPTFFVLYSILRCPKILSYF